MPTKKGRGKASDMFAAQARARTQREAPLAARMRPRTFDEFLGQEHHRDPVQAIAEHHHLIVLVKDLRLPLVGNELAKGTTKAHAGPP